MTKIDSIESSNSVAQTGAIRRSPYYDLYYQDNINDPVKTSSKLSMPVILPVKEDKPCGWTSQDSIGPAPGIDTITQVSKPVQPLTIDAQLASGYSFEFTSEQANVKEAEKILDAAYAKLPSAVQAKVEIEAEKRNNVEHHIEVMSKKIDQALTSEGMDYEHVHALILRYCMLYMRKLAKVDQEFISKIGEQIMIKAGHIKDSYNTWPVVTLTLISSGVSLVAGVGGFSTLVFPGSEIAKTLASNAHQVSTLSTGISGLKELPEKHKEASRGMDQLQQKRLQDKEEEKKTTKQGNNETKKRFHGEIQETDRNRAATVRNIVAGG